MAGLYTSKQNKERLYSAIKEEREKNKAREKSLRLNYKRAEDTPLMLFLIQRGHKPGLCGESFCEAFFFLLFFSSSYCFFFFFFFLLFSLRESQKFVLGRRVFLHPPLFFFFFFFFWFLFFSGHKVLRGGCILV